MELEQELDKLRDEVERWGRQNLGAGIRHDLKGRMVGATKRAIAEGATASQVAEHLGVKPENLSRWLRVDATVVKVEGMLRELKSSGQTSRPSHQRVGLVRHYSRRPHRGCCYQAVSRWKGWTSNNSSLC